MTGARNPLTAGNRDLDRKRLHTSSAGALHIGLTLLAMVLGLNWQASPVEAQSPPGLSIAALNRIQSRTYHFAEVGQDMPYELYVPTTYDATKATPLIVALHGFESIPEQVIRYQGMVDEAENRGYIVVAPLGYNSRGGFGSRGRGRASVALDPNDIEIVEPANLGELSERDVMNVLQIVRDSFNIDENRIYLFGHSMGSAGAWHLALKNPTLFAGLASIAPGLPARPQELPLIRHLPILVMMGDADTMGDLAAVRRLIETMTTLGMRHTYLEIPRGDHTRMIAGNRSNMAKVFDFFDEAGAN